MKNVIVGQSGGPTAVINASLLGVYRQAKKLGANKIYGMCHGVQGLLKEDMVDLSNHLNTQENMQLLRQTPSAFLGACRFKLPKAELGSEIYQDIFDILGKWHIDVFVYIGGNDSMDTIDKLSTYGKIIGSKICFVGVPKTVDNDLALTHHTPGYGSACKYIATTVKEIVCDCLVYEEQVVSVVEMSGRDSGWLTASATLSQGDDCEGVALTLLSELPFDEQHFLNKVGELLNTGRSFVIAVAEGVKDKKGKYLCELGNNLLFDDEFGHTRLTGACRYIARLITKTFGCRTKAMELSFMQRSAGHCLSKTDVEEAVRIGAEAMDIAFSGQSGKVPIFQLAEQDSYRCDIVTVDACLVANAVKHFPLEWYDAENYQILPQFATYALPLIQGEMDIIYHNGLPRHLKLNK